jgi:hypothetical protein
VAFEIGLFDMAVLHLRDGTAFDEAVQIGLDRIGKNSKRNFFVAAPLRHIPQPVSLFSPAGRAEGREKRAGPDGIK